MGMSTYVVGFRPPDAAWTAMRDVWVACEKAGLRPPPEVEKFFCGERPDPHGVEVPKKVLKDAGAVREWEDGERMGYEVDVTKLPDGVKIVRIYNSW